MKKKDIGKSKKSNKKRHDVALEEPVKTVTGPVNHSNQDKKQRMDGIGKSVTAAQNAFREIKPPPHVRFNKRDYPFWDSIVAEYPKMEWTNHALEVAAMLAKAMSELEKEHQMMRREGSVLKRKQIIHKHGVPKKVVITGTYVNPRNGVIDKHTKNVLALRRNLSLHARGQGGEARDVAKRRNIAKQIEDNMTGNDDDGLLARPKVH